jgi:TfoX N-terminal domain
MAYDEHLADRIRSLVEGEPRLTEQKMFGGLAFLVGGHMAIAASREGGLMLRCDPAQTVTLLGEPGAGPMVMRGREMDGWLRVDAGVVADDEALQAWVDRGVSYARSLPPK